jgi:AraC family transcriptional regulator
MRSQASRGEILKVRKPADLIGQIAPLLSSAKSGSDGFLIESYQIPELGPSPRHSYSDRHAIAIHRYGTVKAHQQSEESWAPGHIAICPIGIPQGSYSFLNARVTLATLKPAFIRHAVRDSINPEALEIRPALQLRDEQIDRLLLAAEIEIASGLAAGRIFFEAIGTALAAHLATHQATRRMTLKGHGHPMPHHLLRRALDFIHAHLGHNLSLFELSASVEMSPYHFCRLFKRSTGLPPHKYVNRERIRRAQQLIAENQLSLVEIADDLGFSDQSHFTRTFHRVLGVTPSQYSAGI